MYKSGYKFENCIQYPFELKLKMDALKKLSEISAKPYIGFSKLRHGYHKIKNFRTVKNKFYKKSEGGHSKTILVELKNEVLFLPQYFWDRINETDLDNLNARIRSKKKVYLDFAGKNDETK